MYAPAEISKTEMAVSVPVLSKPVLDSRNNLKYSGSTDGGSRNTCKNLSIPSLALYQFSHFDPQ